MVFILLRRAINWLKTGGGGIHGREPSDEKIRPHFRQGHKNKNFLGAHRQPEPRTDAKDRKVKAVFI